MAEKNELVRSEDLEDLLYETRFLLNVLMDLLVEKKVLTEEEIFDRYDEELSKAEKEVG
ncbi:hypothetical protein ACFL5G_05250 [Candidatus Margulisiibacteriota bacterium]